MPYIDKGIRKLIGKHKAKPANTGQLNYLITALCVDYLGKDYSYSDLNSVIGALECAKQEFYRRAVVPYEEKKIIENGDVYGN